MNHNRQIDGTSTTRSSSTTRPAPLPRLGLSENLRSKAFTSIGPVRIHNGVEFRSKSFKILGGYDEPKLGCLGLPQGKDSIRHFLFLPFDEIPNHAHSRAAINRPLLPAIKPNLKTLQ